MVKRVLIATIVLCVTPCFAVDLRNTQWYGRGEISVTLSGQSDSEPFEGVIVFTGNSPKKGDAALEGLRCWWTSKSESTPSFTLIPAQSAASELADVLREQLPGAKVTVKPMPMKGTASLQTGTISYAVRFKLSIKYQRQRASGFVTISQSGYQLTGLTTTGQGEPPLSKIHEAITHLLNR